MQFITLTTVDCRNGNATLSHLDQTQFTADFTESERIMLSGGFRVLRDPFVYSLLFMANTRPI